MRIQRLPWIVPIIVLIAAGLITGYARTMQSSPSAPTDARKAVPMNTNPATAPAEAAGAMNKVVKTDEEWKRQLTPEQYRVLRQAGTETPYSGKYWNKKEDGTYACAACGQELFKSDAKFDSGCGWPSFYDAMDSGKIVTREDNTHGMRRTEVLCSRCGGHLGHVFEDGPNPTGLRYCINSESLHFEKK